MAEDAASNIAKIVQSPSYRVAYRDVDFLARPEMRAARIELELLKPELYFRQSGVRSTIVVFGSTQITEPAAAQRRLDEARAAGGRTAGRSRSAGGRSIGPSRLCEWSRYYDAAREFARIVSHRRPEPSRSATTWSPPAAGRASWRPPTAAPPTWRHESIGLNIRLPRGAAAQPVHHARTVLPVPLFRHPKAAFRVAGEGVGGLSRRLWHARRIVRRLDAPPDRPHAGHPHHPLRPRILAAGRSTSSSWPTRGPWPTRILDLVSYAETAAEAWETIQQAARYFDNGNYWADPAPIEHLT